MNKILFLLFLLMSSVYAHAQITAEFEYDTEVCGNEITVNDISTGETVISRIWYMDDVLLDDDGPANYTFSVGNVVIADTLMISLVVQGASSQDSVAHQIICRQIPDAYAGDNNYPEVCGNQYTFDADTTGYGFADMEWYCDTQTVTWNGTQYNPDATVTIPSGAYGDSAHVSIPFVWKLANVNCSDRDTVHVTFYETPNANAGSDDSICQNSYGLEATYSIPESSSYLPYGFWYQHPDNDGMAYFQDSESSTTTVMVSEYGESRFIWRENNALRPNCNDRDTITIIFKEKPEISAGDDFDVCGQEACLNGISAGFNGNWLPLPGTNYDDVNDPGTCIGHTGYGPVEFIWQESNEECVSKDTVTVTFWQKPTAELAMDPEDTAVCGRKIGIHAENPGSEINSHWIANPSNSVDFYYQTYNDTIEITYYGYYNLAWVESNGPQNLSPDFCSDTSEWWTVHFKEIPYINITTTPGLYYDSLTLSASTGSYNPLPLLWSSNSDSVIITDPYSETTTAIYNGLTQQEVMFVLESDNMGCYDSDTLVIEFAHDESGIVDEFYSRGNENTLQLFPNPSENSFTIKGECLIYPLDVNVFELSGKSVFTGQINNEGDLIRLPDLPSGVYPTYIRDNTGRKYKASLLVK